jgi:hypothetical protein
MRLPYSTIAITAATFAATLALAPALGEANVSQYLDLGHFLTAAPEKAPVTTTTTTQVPNCRTAFGALVDALGDRECV